MKESDYKDKIVELVCGIDDSVFLRRLYKLICVLTKIDDTWILKQFDLFLENIQK